MIYVSIDIETTGLDAEKNQALSIGAIVEDTTKNLPFDLIPKFNAIILQRDIVGSPRAITMNSGLISNISDYLEGDETIRTILEDKTKAIFLEKEDVVPQLFNFLFANGHSYPFIGGGYVINGVTCPPVNSTTKGITINVAGKNFGTFDKLFLQQLPWWQKLIRTRQRVLDPAILFVDWQNDNSLPSLTTCKERAGIKGIVTHNALEDAWDVIESLRKFY